MSDIKGFDCNVDGGTIEVRTCDTIGTITLVFRTPGKERWVAFSRGQLAQLIGVMLRECWVSTFKWSRRTGRLQVSMHGKHDAREVAHP